MSVTQIEDFRQKQEREKFERERAAGRFTMDMWQEAVEKERYLPRQLAVKLIEQIMIDHGITLKDLSEIQDS